MFLYFAVGRMLPQRPWTTLVPSILSHNTLDKRVLTPVPTASSGHGIGRSLSCSLFKSLHSVGFKVGNRCAFHSGSCSIPKVFKLKYCFVYVFNIQCSIYSVICIICIIICNFSFYEWLSKHILYVSLDLPNLPVQISKVVFALPVYCNHFVI